MAFDIDTASPADNQIISQFPTTERAHRAQLVSIITEEHVEATGYHALPVVADETALLALLDQTDGMYVAQADIGCMMHRQSGAFLSQGGAAYLTAAARAGLSTTALSAGFLVYESDTMKVWGWDGSAWVQLVPGPGWITTDKATDNNQTAVVNTWEDIDGSYNGGTQLGVEFLVPDDGRAYEIFVNAIVRVGTSSNNKHAACRLLEDSVEKDAEHVSWLGAFGSGNAALSYHLSNAVAATTYVYTVEWACDDTDVVVNPTGVYLGKASAGIWTLTNWSRIWGMIRVREA